MLSRNALCDPRIMGRPSHVGLNSPTGGLKVWLKPTKESWRVRPPHSLHMLTPHRLQTDWYFHVLRLPLFI